MTYITGDIHGDPRRLEQLFLSSAGQNGKTVPGDTVIILGDAGFNYFGDGRDRIPKEILHRDGNHTEYFCIHGNHEMRPQTIPSYHERRWHGGTVFVEDEFPNLLFAKDGEVYDIDGYSCLAIGGAYSIDKEYRLLYGYRWFPDEQPDDVIKARVEDRLRSLDYTVDVVLSHTCPRKYEPVEVFLGGVDQRLVDTSTEDWLDSIEDRLDYKRWYCGHYHTEKEIDRLRFLYESLEEFRVPDEND